MKNYLDLMQHILDNGNYKQNRTGTPTYSIFGTQQRFDLTVGFPILTTKTIHFKSVIHELLWFLNGSTNNEELLKYDVTIWNEWSLTDNVTRVHHYTNCERVALLAEKLNVSVKSAIRALDSHDRDEENGGELFLQKHDIPKTYDEIVYNKGELGPIYGAQWRTWKTASGKTIDQISAVIDKIKNNPNSRRILVSAWNVEFLPDESISPQINVKHGKMSLAPCQFAFQFYVFNGELSCHVNLRSLDYFLGASFNIASYALLTHMIAQQCGLMTRELVVTGGDVHIYHNHLEQCKLQLTRTPQALPKLIIKRKPESIFDYKYEDFALDGYRPYGTIKAHISV